MRGYKFGKLKVEIYTLARIVGSTYGDNYTAFIS